MAMVITSPTEGDGPMKLHHVKHLISEILVLGALVLPFALAFAGCIGLFTWMLGEEDMGLHASVITAFTVTAVAPITIRLSLGPDTRAICPNCIPLMASPRSQAEDMPMLQEHRRYPRYHIDLPATLFSGRTSGSVKISNLSQAGCKVEGSIAITPGEFGQLLIDLPGRQDPLKISRAVIRWVIGNECGIEFINLAEHEKGWLHRLMHQLSMGSIGGPLTT